MRSSKINYLIVGLFMVISLVVLLVTTVVLSGRTGATDRYFSIYFNISGVQFGTQIVFEGYPIGQVIEVTPIEDNGRMKFRVDFDVTEGWKIPEDSEVEIAAPGVLAAVNLSIHAGMSANTLEPGAEIKSRERSDIFAVISGLASQFSDLTAEYVKPLISNISNVATSANELLEMRHDGSRIISDARVAIAEITAHIPSVTAKFENLISNLEATATRLNEAISPGNQQKLIAMIDNLNAASQKFDSMLVTTNSMLQDIDDLVMDKEGDVRKSFSDSRYITESIARNIDAINQNMDGAARNLNEFTRQIRKNPGVLLGGSKPNTQEEK